MNRWLDRPPTEQEIQVMVRMLRESGYGVAADMIEALTRKGTDQ